MRKTILLTTSMIISLLVLSGCGSSTESKSIKQADWKQEKLNIKKSKPQNKSIKQADWK